MIDAAKARKITNRVKYNLDNNRAKDVWKALSDQISQACKEGYSKIIFTFDSSLALNQIEGMLTELSDKGYHSEAIEDFVYKISW